MNRPDPSTRSGRACFRSGVDAWSPGHGSCVNAGQLSNWNSPAATASAKMRSF